MGISVLRIIFISVFAISFCSCVENIEVPPPDDLIVQGEMASLICDLSLSEALLANDPMSSFDDSLKRLNVLADHHISANRFLLSMNYFCCHPKLLKELYQMAKDTMERRKY